MEEANEKLFADVYKKQQDELKLKQQQPSSCRDAYFASLGEWVKQAHISQSAMAYFPYYLYRSYPQLFHNPAPTPIAATLPTAAPHRSFIQVRGLNFMMRGGNVNIMNEQMQRDFINRNGGYEHVVAPFWKRAVAELIDVLIFLIVKVLLTVVILNVFDIDFAGSDFEKELLKSLEDENAFLGITTELLAVSSDLLLLEITTKIIVCFYEAMWTRHWGATPGKMFMGLRIVYMEAMVPLTGNAAAAQPQNQVPLRVAAGRPALRALIYPAETPSFKRALMRAVAKNLLMTLLFPMCVLMVFFKDNRTVYDFVTNTIVIEDGPRGPLRRLN